MSFKVIIRARIYYLIFLHSSSILFSIPTGPFFQNFNPRFQVPSSKFQPHIKRKTLVKSRESTSLFSNMQTKNHFTKEPLFLLFCFLFFCSIDAQVLIPAKLDGFWYHNRSPKPDSVVIEAFFDPVCPDSRDSWKPLKEAVQHYGSSVALVVHTFPLPYHDNAFLTSRALHIVDKLNISLTYHLLEAFFEQQEKFYGRATSNITRTSVKEHIAKFAVEAVGSPHSPFILGGFSEAETDQATRIAFKYGCLRGVYGTPFFFVNGFPLPDAGSPLDYGGWLRILDPLVKK